MGKRKKINPKMVALVFIAGVALSFIFKELDKLEKAKAGTEEDVIMMSVDTLTQRLTGAVFPEKELVLAEEINDYEMYINPRYIVLNKTNRALQGIGDYLNMSAKEKNLELAAQKRRIEELLLPGNENISDLVAQKEKLSWMIIFKSGTDEDSFRLLNERMSTIRDSLNIFENKSYGWKYIIDAMYNDSTICRFIMVAPKDNPSKIAMGGGRIMTRREKEEENTNQNHFFSTR